MNFLRNETAHIECKGAIVARLRELALGSSMSEVATCRRCVQIHGLLERFTRSQE